MTILINNEIPRESWHEFFERNPFSTPFQTPEFYSFYNSIQGFSAIAIACEFKGQLTALAIVTIQKEKGIKGFFSRRGIIYGGPLINPEFPEALEDLLRFISSFFKNKLIYIETRNFNDLSVYKNIFKQNHWEYLPYLNFHLKIKDKNSIVQSISSSRKRQISKAIKSGAIFKEARNLTEVKAFYEILYELYKSKIRKPLPSWDFFKAFFQSGTGKYLLVYYDNRVIGGIMCPILAGKSIYEFYVCGLDTEYKEQYPSVLATWAAIEYALQNDIKLFDFMGAGKPDENYGVRDFKARFGGEEMEYGRFLKVEKPFLYRIGNIGLKILSKI
jgi:serine/alanine adding enzyme